MKNTEKAILLAFALCLCVCIPDECFAEVVGVLRGPSGIPCARLMECYPAARYELFASASQLLPKMIKGEVDIGFLPPNVAAKAYNVNKGAVRALAVSANAAVSLVTRDHTITGLSDLRGKTVYVAGQGATPDLMLRYLLHSSALDTGERGVSLAYSVSNAQLAPALVSGRIEYAVVPEPFTTVAMAADDGVVKAVDVAREFARLHGGQVPPTTLIVANAAFAKQHPDVIKSFLSEYERAHEWTLANTKEAGAAVERAGLGLTASVATKAIPNCAFVFIPAKETRQQIEGLLALFLEFDEASVGKKLPDSGFYFE